MLKEISKSGFKNYEYLSEISKFFWSTKQVKSPPTFEPSSFPKLLNFDSYQLGGNSWQPNSSELLPRKNHQITIWKTNIAGISPFSIGNTEIHLSSIRGGSIFQVSKLCSPPTPGVWMAGYAIQRRSVFKVLFNHHLWRLPKIWAPKMYH